MSVIAKSRTTDATDYRDETGQLPVLLTIAAVFSYQ